MAHSVFFILRPTTSFLPRQTLVESRGDNAEGVLAIFVDGRYWGTGYFQTARAADFVPSAGFLTSRFEAERIVDVCA